MLVGYGAGVGVAVFWFMGCAAMWVSLRRWSLSWPLAHPAFVVAAVAAVARIVPAVMLDRGLMYDIDAHWYVGNLVLQGRNVYTAAIAQHRYPYPPLHMYVSALMVWLSGGSRTLFLVVDKLAPALCGIGLSVAIWATSGRLGLSPRQALLAALLYAANPLPILVTSYHGQFEEIPLLLVAVALLLLAGRAQPWYGVVGAALCLGLAIAYKAWPVLFFPALWIGAHGVWRKSLFALVAPLPLVLSLWLLYLAHGRQMLELAMHRILGYSGPNTFCWGYVSALNACWIRNDKLRPNGWVLSLNHTLLYLGLALVVALLLWRRRVLEGMVAMGLVFYIFSPGWGPNYSTWVLPFAVLAGATLATRYTLLMLPIIGLTYLDSLYVAYGHNAYSYAVLKPIEAALGLVAWVGVCVLVAALYLAPGSTQPS